MSSFQIVERNLNIKAAIMKREIINIYSNDPSQSGISHMLISRNNSNYTSGKMRKYYQASLAIIAAVSLISLLFYRHEYNKLRYVLEVFNYFGEFHAKNLTNCTEILPNRPTYYFSEPLPSWQRLSDELYMYSSYNVDKKIVRTIAFGKIDESLKCEVFYEEKVHPVSGSFSYSKIESSLELQDLEDEEYQGYYFKCEYAGNEQRPVAVKYYKNSHENVYDIPIMSINNSPLKMESDDSYSAICISPPLEKPLEYIDMVSFLSLHNFTGFQHFVVYDYGIPNVFNRVIKNAALRTVNYETVPWNFPFTGIDINMIKDIIEADCLHRTINRVAYVVTLSWNEYIVLKYHEKFITVANLIKNLEKNKIIGSRYAMKTLVFCTEQDNDKHSINTMSVIFKKTHNYPDIFERRSVDICKPHEVFSAEGPGKKQVSANLIVVNRYQHCRGISNIDLESTTYDNSILRYIKAINNSAISRIFSSRLMTNTY